MSPPSPHRFYGPAVRAFLGWWNPVADVPESPERLGYTRIPVVSSARSLYGRIEPSRGNLVVVLEATAQLEALRRSRPTGFITPSQTRGIPGATPTTFRGGAVEGLSMPRATFPEEETESLAQQRMRLSRRGIYSHPSVTELPLNVPPRPLQSTRVEREDYATLIIPAEVLGALREYYARRGATRVTQAEEINAAAYAIFTAKLTSLPLGRSVTARADVGSPRWVLEHLAASEVPGRGVRGESLAPGRFPENWSPPNLPGEIPVTYETIVAVLFFVHGPLYLRRENFSNIIRDQLGWHPCGTSGVFSLPRTGMFLPATNSVIWCPPPRSFPIQPPSGGQRTFGGAPPPFPQHTRPIGKAAPPRYRGF